jgi:uncharacterized cupredoxin-like copper-binding protein
VRWALLVALLALAPAAEARTTAVGVGLREFQLSPYRDVVRTGTVKFNVTNFGQDAHDLAVLRRGRTYGKTPEIRAGERAVLRLRLKPGRYRLVCTIADHEDQGMKARLRVRRANQGSDP